MDDDFILVIANCGASVAENCTYFESAGGESGIYIVENFFRKRFFRQSKVRRFVTSVSEKYDRFSQLHD